MIGHDYDFESCMIWQEMLREMRASTSLQAAKYLWREMVKARKAYRLRGAIDEVQDAGGEYVKLNKAIIWLEAYLESGEAYHVIPLLNTAYDDGHKKRTIQDAAKAIGVIKRKVGRYKGRTTCYTWQLPEYALLTTEKSV